MSDGLPLSLGHGTCVRTTENAVLVSLDDHGEKWIPKSVLHDDSEVYDDGHTGDTVITEGWWTEKENIT